MDLQTELAKYWNADDEQERMYGFLSPDKRDRVSQLQTKYEQLEQEIYASSKGVMLDEDREIALRRRLPTLWSRSYFVSTVGTVSAATIKGYIDTQWERPWRKEAGR